MVGAGQKGGKGHEGLRLQEAMRPGTTMIRVPLLGAIETTDQNVCACSRNLPQSRHPLQLAAQSQRRLRTFYYVTVQRLAPYLCVSDKARHPVRWGREAQSIFL